MLAIVAFPRMRIPLCIACLIFTVSIMNAQETSPEPLPYRTIPSYPEEYTPGAVIARLIDGLGFRYYWATEGLRPEDLIFKPSETNRTTAETLDHIYNLSEVILNSALKKANDRSAERQNPKEFNDLRIRTLRNLEEASQIFLKSTDLSEHQVIFKTKERTAEFPFWNQINGPIADAIWHCGQVVLLRRASGNPIDPGVSVFRGTRRSQ